MQSNPFLQLRLVGNRFEGHSIPLAFLPGLAPLQALIVEAAKVEYLRNHVSRKRVPKGFERSMELKLTSIKRGSVQLDVGLDKPKDSPLNPNQEGYFLRARDRLISTIQEAEKNELVECPTLSKG